MFFDKKKYIVPISGGKGIVNTTAMRGMVVHLIIRPEPPDKDEPVTEWALQVFDKDGDELMEVFDHEGRLDYTEGIPLGKDAQEKLTLSFTRVSKNKPIKVVFLIKELG